MRKYFSYNKKDFVEWLLSCGIFCEFYLELICIIISISIINQNNRIRLNVNLLLIIILLFIYSFTCISLANYSFFKFFQQYLLITPFIIGYAIIFYNLKNNINSLFNKYLKVASIVSLLGLIQFVIYFTTNVNIFYYLYDRPANIVSAHIIRVCSIVDEPGYLSFTLTPAVCYYIFKWRKSNIKHAIITLTAFFLTFGAVSYVVFFCICIFRVWILNKKYFFYLVFIIGAIIYIYGANFINQHNNGAVDISTRLKDSYQGLMSMDINDFEALNLSSYALLSNTWVSLNAPNRMIGTGLGTHEQNYRAVYKSTFQYYGFNSKDGYSLLNRLYSEFGIIGLIVLLGFLIRNKNYKNIINIAAFFILISFMIKGGHYVRYGLIFWFFMYYYSSKIMQQ